MARGWVMEEVNPSDHDRLVIREPVAKPLEVPDAQVARMSGHVEMSKVEKTRTNASDGSLRHYQQTNQADSLPADWEEQNTSLELQDGDISISRSNKLKEADLVRGSSKNSSGKPYEVYTAEASQEVRKLDSHKGDLNVAMAAAETLDTPMTSAQRAGVTALVPMFFFEGGGKSLDSAAAKQMKLDRMTEEELKMLGIERKEMLMPEVFKDKKQVDSEAEEAQAAFQKPVADQVLIASTKTPNLPNLEQMQQYSHIQSDSEKPKIAQYSDGYMPPPTILPDFIIKAGIDIWNGTEKPFAGVEDALMAATMASNAHAWEDAAKRFPQLAGVSPALMKAYTRNELAFYSREDLAQDMAAADGHSLGSNPTLGMAQITTKGVHEFEQKYPQLHAFLASKGYSGPGHEMQALLDPECVPMIVAAKTASTMEDMQKHGIKKPTNEQIAYAYNPDVFSYSDGKDGKEFKALYGLEINASQALHWEQHKEYYAKDPHVIEASKHVKNVLLWLK